MSETFNHCRVQFGKVAHVYFLNNNKPTFKVFSLECFTLDFVLCLTISNSLRQMKEMKHENLVQFFGVCIDPPNVCLVMQYCRKGSLKVCASDKHISITALINACLHVLLMLHIFWASKSCILFFSYRMLWGHQMSTLMGYLSCPLLMTLSMWVSSFRHSYIHQPQC